MVNSNILHSELSSNPIRNIRIGFESIPRDISKAELFRYFTYSPEDRNEIFLCRGDSNKVGFALLLGGIRLTGRLPTSLELINSSLLTHVCRQLNVENMLFLDYPHRRPTRHDHMNRIRGYLELRSFSSDDQMLITNFVREQIRVGISPDDLQSHTEKYLRAQNTVLPGVTVLDKLISTATIKAEEELYECLQQKVLPDNQERILNLLIIADGEKITSFQKLQQVAVRPSPDALIRELSHIEQICSLIPETLDFADIPQALIERWARLTAGLPTRSLQRFRESKRVALLLSWLWHIRTQIIDTALTVANVLIGGVVRRAEHGFQKIRKQQQRRMEKALKSSSEIMALVLHQMIRCSKP